MPSSEPISFPEFLQRDIRRFAWNAAKDGHLPCAYGIGTAVRNNSKEIFLNAVKKYAQEYGADELIKHKSSIMHYAKAHKVNVVDITKLLYTCVGKEAVDQFEHKSVHSVCIWISIILMIISFLAGALLF